MTDYYLIETKDLYDENSVGGGLGKSGDPRQRKIVYVRVNSVDENSANTERLGGKVIQPKMTDLDGGISLRALIQRVMCLVSGKLTKRPTYLSFHTYFA